ncbi:MULTISPECIES: 3-oxoacid CoA-transferase subunit B [Fictibacillus]|jgi:acetate CoA/acetoacetate CoA-transferase beta subunit|uniref:3-oxoacid CoA-transferase subunit B n=1 Tax=Fictibacillus TaxID=1329200 RepID=UPI0018CE015E|nr:MULTISPECIES: 3-oxoacid CoA-transferase subunit B [unclassified Fictibacillus]MBH0156060.1 3-oxoacid CoA-transferase subunit B [Fictibacillus sp. 5RED26]MBH0160828.1 3-oxoacid CoA-transferase subunit B [Fictibacillus sp. 26RED30]MBH0165720.1 3-oxoacid CoA-transferase subunit B [Fictibacillus sp. 7GRE50]MBH0173231.1 3-oxoacid CoA-transferase subunit B [Fictibacillus sp. 23RED33]
MGLGIETRHRIARRAALEISYGMIVNLGIGIPTLVADYIENDLHIMLHTENGILGMGGSPEAGSEDGNLSNAGGYPVSIHPGASYFDSATAFGIIRKGLLDVTILGALEVSERGDIANWIVPGKRVPGMGGAIDLAQKAKKVIILMNHTDKYGNPKIVRNCSLPLTVKEGADMIITEKAVFHCEDGKLVLREIMSPYTLEDVIQTTGASIVVDEHISVFQ